MEKSYGRYGVGLLIILIGAIALLNNFGITAVSLSWLLNLVWPLLFVAAGINWITRANSGDRVRLASIVTGAILVAVGVLFFGANAGLFDLDKTSFWKGFWPVIIILIGINIMFKNEHNIGANMAIMGAVDKTKDSWELSSGDYTAVMGGIDLDIRKANFTEREVTLNLTAIMGGISIIVPEDVPVTCQGTAILGAVDLLGKESGGIIGNATTQSGDLQRAARVLHLKCTCIMGGIEVKR
ncbi:MAG TPA: cell wall-active antibiotics response protein [Syntrophomonadaceae bacterium]|nr:cell wall-active antibiotics response protein [Syntrophomonadaceae bacterium]